MLCRLAAPTASICKLKNHHPAVEWADVVTSCECVTKKACRKEFTSQRTDFIVFNIYNKYILQYKIHVHIYRNLSEKIMHRTSSPESEQRGLDPKGFTQEETTSTPKQ